MKIALILIIIHYIADFIFQDEKWSLGKSKNWNDLLFHTITYTLVFLAAFIIMDVGHKIIYGSWAFDVFKVQLFLLITFVCHTITDYFTSRWVSGKFKRNHLGSSIPNFGAFSAIGFDQVLHYAQLFLTYHLLTL